VRATHGQGARPGPSTHVHTSPRPRHGRLHRVEVGVAHSRDLRRRRMPRRSVRCAVCAHTQEAPEAAARGRGAGCKGRRQEAAPRARRGVQLPHGPSPRQAGSTACRAARGPAVQQSALQCGLAGSSHLLLPTTAPPPRPDHSSPSNHPTLEKSRSASNSAGASSSSSSSLSSPPATRELYTSPAAGGSSRGSHSRRGAQGGALLPEHGSPAGQAGLHMRGWWRAAVWELLPEAAHAGWWPRRAGRRAPPSVVHTPSSLRWQRAIFTLKVRRMAAWLGSICWPGLHTCGSAAQRCWCRRPWRGTACAHAAARRGGGAPAA
jgi:hypothetical protein